MAVGAVAQDDQIARFEKAEGDRRTCRANLMTLTNAQMAFRVRYRGFTSNLSLLRQDIREMPVCPGGGKYSVVLGKPTNAFTMHCSVLRHDAGRVHPAGFTPSVNGELEYLEDDFMLDAAGLRRRTCRANLQTIANAESWHKSEKGMLTADLGRLMEVLGAQPICPEGGTYSIVLGLPADSFTVHCTVKAHDAGMVEPRGYSPGRNSE